MKVRALAASFGLILLLAPAAATAQSFDAWFDEQIETFVNRQTVGANGAGLDRQRDAPADDRSASLVDQSSATDFVSLAVNLARVAGAPSAGESSSNDGSQMVTASFYALLAAANGKRLTDPSFYASHVDARRVSLTVGTTASETAVHGTNRPASVLGAKVLLINGRDLFTRPNQERLQTAQQALRDATKEGAILKSRIRDIIFTFLRPNDMKDGVPIPERLLDFANNDLASPTFAAMVLELPEDVRQAIETEIANAIAPFVALRTQINRVYDEIRGSRQLALSVVSRLRPDAGHDEHRAELIFDYGLSPRLTWTANGSFDYVDRHAAGVTRSGRFATEFVGEVTNTPPDWGRLPVRVSGGMQFRWADGETQQKDVQVKLTVPLAPGLDLPFVYRYTWAPSSSVESGTKGSQARVTLAIDVARVFVTR